MFALEIRRRAVALATLTARSTLSRGVTVAIAVAAGLCCGRMTIALACPGPMSHSCAEGTSNQCSTTNCYPYSGPAMCDTGGSVLALKLTQPVSPWYYCASGYWNNYTCTQISIDCGTSTYYTDGGCLNSCPVTNGPILQHCAPDLVNSNICSS
jgi:hypothetical protein